MSKEPTNDHLIKAMGAALQHLPEGCRITMVVSAEVEPGKHYLNRISNSENHVSKLHLETSLKVLKHGQQFGRRNDN